MRRSKLETYEAILEALSRKPMNMDRLAYKVSLNCISLRKSLDFLEQNGLIEERFLQKGIAYAATERGFSVHKTLDSQKYFKKIRATIRAIDEAMQVLPDASNHREN